MKDENKRNLYLKVRVSQEEMDAIKRKFQNSGMDTLSGFVRAIFSKQSNRRFSSLYLFLCKRQIIPQLP